MGHYETWNMITRVTCLQAVTEKLQAVCSSIYSRVLIVTMHTYGCGEVLISEE